MPVLPKFPAPLRGALFAATVFCGMAFAQSGLTTIQDTLFKADGTRFTGTLSIQWSTFDSTSIGTIVQQSRSVAVTNGNLYVQLVPNSTAAAPANVYTVHYQSDGNQQFTETWSVPVSASALTVAEVRTGMMTTSGGASSGSSSGSQGPVTESSVTGLLSDLAQRPIKGPAFGAGSVAVINQNGQIEAAVGDVGECVFVDGTAGPCGGAASQFFDAETPGGIVDGTNNTFTLLNPPSGSSLALFRNGLYMSANFDYTLTGQTIVFPGAAPPPQPGDTLVANYRIDPSSVTSDVVSSGSSTPHTVMAQVLCSSTGQSTGGTAWASLGSCDIPAAALRPGDRIEVRFSFTHTGTTSGFGVQINWGIATIVARQGSTQDAAFVGQAEAAIGTGGVQMTVQSWGTVLSFLPAIVSAPVQNGVSLSFRGQLLAASGDSLALTSFTVLRYPAN
jgi:hypothetical protein